MYHKKLKTKNIKHRKRGGFNLRNYTSKLRQRTFSPRTQIDDIKYYAELKQFDIPVYTKKKSDNTDIVLGKEDPYWKTLKDYLNKQIEKMTNLIKLSSQNKKINLYDRNLLTYIIYIFENAIEIIDSHEPNSRNVQALKNKLKKRTMEPETTEQIIIDPNKLVESIQTDIFEIRRKDLPYNEKIKQTAVLYDKLSEKNIDIKNKKLPTGVEDDDEDYYDDRPTEVEEEDEDYFGRPTEVEEDEKIQGGKTKRRRRNKKQKRSKIKHRK